MRKILLRAAILVVLFFIPKIVFGAVVINEVLYNAEGVDTGKEYIILYNNGDTNFDLTGYQLNAVSGDYYTFPGFSLSAKSFINIYWRKDGTNSTTDLYTGITGFDANMGDTSGWVALFKNSQQTKDTIVDYLEYGAGGKTFESKAVDAGIWTTGSFIGNVQEGKAIKLQTDGIDNNLPSDWIEIVPSIAQQESSSSQSQESSQQSSQQDQQFTINQPPIADAGDNIIAFTGQEIKFDGSKSSDPNNSELAYSWNMGDGKLIEQKSFTYKYIYPGTYLVTLMVYNGRNYASETITIKIQPQQITINEFLPNPSGKDEEEEWIEIYNGSDFIVDISNWQLDDMASGSKAFVFPQNTLIAPKSYLVFTRRITGIALNNDKDSVRLLFPEGIVFQEINYEKPPQGKSSARTDEGFVWSLPTPGAPNISGVVISVNKNISYQGPAKTQTVKEPSQDYAVLFQNQQENKIEGGYATMAQPQNNIQKTENSQLAAVAPDSSKQNQNNLFLIIAIIVLVGLLVGVLLTRALKRFP